MISCFHIVLAQGVKSSELHKIYWHVVKHEKRALSHGCDYNPHLVSDLAACICLLKDME